MLSVRSADFSRHGAIVSPMPGRSPRLMRSQKSRSACLRLASSHSDALSRRWPGARPSSGVGARGAPCPRQNLGGPLPTGSGRSKDILTVLSAVAGIPLTTKLVGSVTIASFSSRVIPSPSAGRSSSARRGSGQPWRLHVAQRGSRWPLIALTRARDRGAQDFLGHYPCASEDPSAAAEAVGHGERGTALPLRE